MSFRMIRNSVQLLLALIIMNTLALAAAGPGEALAAKLVDPATRKTAGKAYVERLGRVYVSGAGLLASARGGDWRLGNEHVSFTFAGVEDLPTTYSMAVKGYEELRTKDDRIPGALIDIAVDDATADVISFFTQAIGLDASRLPVRYDTAEPLSGPEGAGIRFTGSPFENRMLRLETTYWLAGGSNRLRIESRFTEMEPGERAPQLVDVANWGAAAPIIKGIGYIADDSSAQPVRTLDYILCQEGGMGMALALRTGKLHGRFTSAPNTSRMFAAPYDSETSAPKSAEVFQRDLWLVRGQSADALEVMLRDKKIPTGTISGKMTLADGKPLPRDARVRVMSYDRGVSSTPPTLLTMKAVDADGRFRVSLPANEWFFTKGEVRGMLDMAPQLVSTKIEAGKDKTKNITMGDMTGIRIQVIDADTKHLIAARLRFEAIAPTRPIYFGFPTSADAYLDTAYIPPLGDTIRLHEGHWIVYATHGIEYELASKEFKLPRGKVDNMVIALKRSNPTPGWLGVEIGARTTATPGVAITARDMALMCAAEGLQWVVACDFERLTDLNPVIKELGLADTLRASTGFRTLMPTHPNWGHFLVYPVAKGAPDPAKASAQWAKVKSAGEFFSILRKLYPGAIIECELAFTETPGTSDELHGPGYFMGHGVNPREVAWNGPPDRRQFSYDFDAIGIIPERIGWNLNLTDMFYHVLYVAGFPRTPVCTPASSFVYGAEPGYPRVLVKVGKDDVAKVTEKELFDAFRKRRTQITNGAFIDMSIDGAQPGDIMPRDDNKVMKTRITAPGWIELNRIQITKDGNSDQTLLSSHPLKSTQRFPDPESGKWREQKLEQLKLRDFKDTLAGVTAIGGSKPLDDALPRYAGQANYPFAFISPIVIDADKNGKYDRIGDYSWRGR
ncbi:hypothetical protein LLG95_15515 [bacterium]|nr:hypothetical protein [bacterium]